MIGLKQKMLTDTDFLILYLLETAQYKPTREMQKSMGGILYSCEGHGGNYKLDASLSFKTRWVLAPTWKVSLDQPGRMNGGG